MKTAQRILTVALALFNEHGEAAMSSVDIANECDISPGNLYYHFKGKEQMVEGLMKLHRAQMNEVLDPQRIRHLSVDDIFYYFFLIIEKLHLFRFLYRSPADLMEKYADYGHQQARLLKQMESIVEQLFTQCHAEGQMKVEDTTLANVTQLTTMIITQSCQYDQLMSASSRFSNRRDSPDAAQYHALSMLVTALLPRCQVSEQVAKNLYKAIELQELTSGTSDPTSVRME